MGVEGLSIFKFLYYQVISFQISKWKTPELIQSIHPPPIVDATLLDPLPTTQNCWIHKEGLPINPLLYQITPFPPFEISIFKLNMELGEPKLKRMMSVGGQGWFDEVLP